MSLYRKILVATDLGPSADPALRTAIELARAVGGSVVALHVTGPSPETRRFYAPLFPDEIEYYRRVEERQREAALAALRERVESLRAAPDDPAIEAVVRSGEPGDEIIRAAGDLAADLVVTGTHGRTGLSHLLLGSVAERVVRGAPCAVLTVRGPVA